MGRSPQSKTPATLSKSVHHQLSMYALAASAAGVGILALAQPSQAKIIYTPAHKKITFRWGGGISFDLNHDGIEDFYVFGYGMTSRSAFLTAQPTAQGRGADTIVTVRSGDNNCAVAFQGGKSVGPKRQFTSGGFMFFVATPTFSICPWRGLNKAAYLGLKIVIEGKTHYGWARLSVQSPGHGVEFSKAFLTGYAYETIPNKPINAGKEHDADDSAEQPDTTPDMLGRLALGRR